MSLLDFARGRPITPPQPKSKLTSFADRAIPQEFSIPNPKQRDLQSSVYLNIPVIDLSGEEPYILEGLDYKVLSLLAQLGYVKRIQGVPHLLHGYEDFVNHLKKLQKIDLPATRDQGILDAIQEMDEGANGLPKRLQGQKAVSESDNNHVIDRALRYLTNQGITAESLANGTHTAQDIDSMLGQINVLTSDDIAEVKSRLMVTV